MIQKSNLHESPFPCSNAETFTTLLNTPSLRIESIRSWLTEPGKWYDQDEDEWVALIEGTAAIEINGVTMELNKGDCFFIPKHTLHRVLYTSENALWIGVFSS